MAMTPQNWWNKFRADPANVEKPGTTPSGPCLGREPSFYWGKTKEWPCRGKRLWCCAAVAVQRTHTPSRWAILSRQLVLCIPHIATPHQRKGRRIRQLKNCWAVEAQGQSFSYASTRLLGSVLQSNLSLKKEANQAVQEQLHPFKLPFLTVLYALFSLHLSTAFQRGCLKLVAIYKHVILTARYWWEQHGALGLCGHPAGNFRDTAGGLIISITTGCCSEA